MAPSRVGIPARGYVPSPRSPSSLTGSASRHSASALTKKGTGFPMTRMATDLIIIMCPVCGSDGSMLRHDIRCSLRYSCQLCNHEWQIDPAAEPQQADLTVGLASVPALDANLRCRNMGSDFRSQTVAFSCADISRAPRNIPRSESPRSPPRIKTPKTCQISGARAAGA